MRQQELGAVGGDELFHFERSDVLEAAAELRQQPGFLVGRMARLMRSVWNSPDCFSMALRIRPRDLPLDRDQFRHEQAGEDAVFLRDVALDAQAAGFLTADDDGLAFHQGADVFEADGGFVDLHTEHRGDGVHLVAGGDGADDGASPAPVLLEVIQSEGEHLVRSEPSAVAIHDAEAVGVAIEAEAEVGLAAADECADFAHAFGVRFRMVAAEEGIDFIMEDGDARARFCEEMVEIAVAGAVHQFDGDFQAGLPDGGEINQLAQLFEIIGQGINRPAREGADGGGGESPVLRDQPGDGGFDPAGDFGVGGRAVGGGEFEALVFGGVVAGGEVDAAEGLTDANGVSDDGGGGVAFAQERKQAVGGEDFGGGESELAAEEPGVVAEDDDGFAAVEGDRESARSSWRKVAMPCVARRTLSKVKSRAIRPRQPEVPNLMLGCMVGRVMAAGGGEVAARKERAPGPALSLSSRTRAFSGHRHNPRAGRR